MYEKRHFDDLASAVRHIGTKAYHNAPEDRKEMAAELVAEFVVGLEQHFLRVCPRFKSSLWLKAASPACITSC